MPRIVRDSDDESASEAELGEGPMENVLQKDESSREIDKTNHIGGVHTEQARDSGGTSSSGMCQYPKTVGSC